MRRNIYSKTIKALFAALCTTLALQATNTFASVQKGWEVDLDFDGIKSELLVNDREYYGQDIVYTGTPIKVEPKLVHLEGFWKGRDVPDYVLVNGVDYKVEVTGHSVKNTVKSDSYNKIIEKITVGERKVFVSVAPGNTLDGETPKIYNYGTHREIDGIRYEADEIKKDSHNFCNMCIKEKGYVLSSDLDEYYSSWNKAMRHTIEHQSGYQTVPLLIYNKKTLTKTTVPTEYTYNNYTINGPGTYTVKVIAMGEISDERHYSSDARDYIGVKTFKITVKDGRSSGQQSPSQSQNQNGSTQTNQNGSAQTNQNGSAQTNQNGSTQTKTPSVKPETIESYQASTPKSSGKTTTVSATEKQITSTRSDKSTKSSTFSILKARQDKVTKHAIKIKWKGVRGASSYTVYGARCGGKFKKLTTTRAKSFTQKKLKSGKYYKFIVTANNTSGEAIVTSKTIHIATKGNVGNPKKVALNAKKKALSKKGKTFKLKVQVEQDGMVKKHRKICFESSNPSVAKVSKKGKIVAVSKGTCYIFAYAQNGAYKSIKIKVKK